MKVLLVRFFLEEEVSMQQVLKNLIPARCDCPGNEVLNPGEDNISRWREFHNRQAVKDPTASNGAQPAPVSLERRMPGTHRVNLSRDHRAKERLWKRVVTRGFRGIGDSVSSRLDVITSYTKEYFAANKVLLSCLEFVNTPRSLNISYRVAEIKI